MSRESDQSGSRVEELETRLAFQEKAIDELSSVVYQQERRIERLSHLVTQLQQKTSELISQASDGSDGHEPPPHY